MECLKGVGSGFPALDVMAFNVPGIKIRYPELAPGERQLLAGTDFSPGNLVADLGMASTRVKGQFSGDRSAYRFRPVAVVCHRQLKESPCYVGTSTSSKLRTVPPLALITWIKIMVQLM